MSQFFISCKESRIENNKSFYGCFYLGPFEPSQSITIANALRRTLLSELYGLGIVSVEIEGATHEYSTLPGIKDSVLDILLNLKEIVLKKTIKNFKPQIGYLRVRGPGVVRASHLHLPPFIQSVDPNQYIATLADNGFLNMKFIIQYGNKWVSPQMPQNNPNKKNTKDQNNVSNYQINTENPLGLSSLFPNDHETNNENSKNNGGHAPNFNSGGGESIESITPLQSEYGGLSPSPKMTQRNSNNFNLHLKKRRLIFKKLKQIGIASTNLYINMLAQNATFLLQKKMYLSKNKRGIDSPIGLTLNKKYTGVNFKILPNLKNLSKSIERSILTSQSDATDKKQFRRGLPPMRISGEFSKRLKKIGASLSLNPQITHNPNNTNKWSFPKGTKEKNLLAEFLVPRIHSPNKPDGLLFFSDKKTIFSNSNPLMIDAVFNPISKVNYIIEINDFKAAVSKMEISQNTSELYELFKYNSPNFETKRFLHSENINEFISITNPINSGYFHRAYSDSDKSAAQNNIIEGNKEDKWNPGTINAVVFREDLEHILKIKNEIDAYGPVPAKKTIKHNITLEIWTNGSIHPRDALYQSFKNLIKVFSKLKKINTLQNNQSPYSANQNFIGPVHSDSDSAVPSVEQSYYSASHSAKLEQTKLAYAFSDQSSADYSSKAKKKIKMGDINTTFIKELIPINDTSFLSSYISPTLKNYNFGGMSPMGMGKTMQPEEFLISEEKKNYKENYFKLEATDYAPSDEFNQIYQTDIGSLNLSLRSYTCLKRFKINFIGDLINLSKTNLLQLNNLKNKLGQTSVKEINISLEKKGFSHSHGGQPPVFSF